MRLTTPPPMRPSGGRITSPPPMLPRPLVRPRFYGLRGTRPTRPAHQFAGFGSTATPIYDTGMRGFLKWAQREYPAQLYQQIAARVQQQVPQAFSGYMLGGWRKFAKIGALGDSTVDTSDAANSTPSSASWSDQVSQIIGTVTGAYVSASQAANQQAIVQYQLQQAQAGKAPANISLSSAGITFGSTTAMSLGGIVLIGALAFLGLRAAKVI